MGIDGETARRALNYTGYQSIDLAIEWLYSDSPLTSTQLEDSRQLVFKEERLVDRRLARIPAGRSYGNNNNNNQTCDIYRMIYIVNTSLNITSGIIAAQIAKASIVMYERLLNDQTLFGQSLMEWSVNGKNTIVYKVKSGQQLAELYEWAFSLALPTYPVNYSSDLADKHSVVTVNVDTANDVTDNVDTDLI
ncbi:uncharacterized protein LOC128953596 [Oppia nitens]|uniref:uncharacterized protein LOC128953596 n=1 Tax=Oppia nitens TaxID=1686743 RepID=UPI0023DB4E02|nr:uncharacterized protein LOC128953596 [Oppia nitens]